MDTVFYNSPDRVPVLTGDRVTVRRFLFWKFTGSVVYVPGISPKRRDMEDETVIEPAARWRRICIKYENGVFDKEDVAADRVLKDAKIKFISRGDPSIGITPDDVISEEDEYGREDDALFPPKPGIRLLKTTERRMSKLGGDPNLPDNIEWPKNPQGIELDLLAQIHCPELPGGLGLPEKGTLFFFYDCNEQVWGLYPEKDRAFWEIVYTEDSIPMEPRQRSTESKGNEFREVFVKFQQFESALSDAYRIGGENDRHQLLGHPLWIQTMVGDIDKEYILLLQIDSDDHKDGPGWMWGDAGRIYFTIKPEDLTSHRFDKAKIKLECD